MASGAGPSDQRPQTARTLGVGGAAFYNDINVPPSLAEIAPILRIADRVEEHNLRVAYICRFYAFEKAHRLDPNSIGRGVRQFKTALLQRLEWDDGRSLMGRVEESDDGEMLSFYQHYYMKYIHDLQHAADKADRAQLAKAYQTANVLLEVLKAAIQAKADALDREVGSNNA